MADINDEAAFDEVNHPATAPKVEEDENSSHGDSKDDDMCSQNQMPSQKHEVDMSYEYLLKFCRHLFFWPS